MLKLPFLNNKKTEAPLVNPNKNYLAIDIGTEVLKVLMFSVDDLGVRIKRTARIQQQQSAMSRGKIQNLTTVLENCRLAISEIKDGLDPDKQPDNIVMGIAGEFIQGVSIVVNYEREEKYDEDVTAQEEQHIINVVQQQIISEGKMDLALRTGLAQEDIEILHITITGMEIGGMNVDSIVGFRGKSIKFYFYASFAPKTYLESLRSLSKSLEMNMLGIVAQPFAVARAYSGSRNKDFSGIFLDIGGGTTDIAVVKNGNVLDSQMFGFGGRVFTKEIAKVMNLDYRHAELRKVKYAQNELEKDVHNTVRDIVYPTAELWMKTLKAGLQSLDDVGVFPSQIYLCGGGALLPDIKNVMMEFPWTKLLPFSSVPKVNIFLPERLYEIIDETGDLNHAYDVTPAALARFAYDRSKNPNNYYLTV